MSVQSLTCVAFQWQHKNGTVSSASPGRPIPVGRKAWLTISRFRTQAPSKDAELTQDQLVAAGYAWKGAFLVKGPDGSVARAEGKGADPDSGPAPGYAMDGTEAVQVTSAAAWIATIGTNLVIRFLVPGTFEVWAEDGIVPGLESPVTTYTAEAAE